MVVDISDPVAPNIEGHLDLDQELFDMVEHDGLLFVLGWTDLYVLDTSETPVLQVAEVVGAGGGTGIEVVDGYGYVIGADGMWVVDFNNPAPWVFAQLPLPNQCNAISVTDGVAYVSNHRGMHVVDVSDPYRPDWIGGIETPAPATDITIAGGNVILATTDGIYLVDISDRRAPAICGAVDGTWGLRVEGQGNPLYVARGFEGIDVIELGPDCRGAVTLSVGTRSRAQTVVFAGDAVLVGSIGMLEVLKPPKPKETVYGMAPLQVPAVAALEIGSHVVVIAEDGVLEVFDVSHAGSPVSVASIATGVRATAADDDGRTVLVAGGWDGVAVVDLGDPRAPGLEGVVAVPGEALDVKTRGGVAYVASGYQGLQVLAKRTADGPWEVVGAVETTNRALDLALGVDYAVVVNGGPEGVVDVIEFPTLSEPIRVAQFQTDGSLRFVEVSGSYAIVGPRVAVLDMFDPRMPSVAAVLDPVLYAESLAIDGNARYLYASALRGLWILDIEDPRHPIVTTRAMADWNLGVVTSGSKWVYATSDAALLVLKPQCALASGQDACWGDVSRTGAQ